MHWLLIIVITSTVGQNTVHEIPMQTIELCEKAKSILAGEMSGLAYTAYHHAYAICVRTQNP
jgi:hypothetical protein